MKNILIVDDSKNNRMFLNALLEDYCDSNPNISLNITESTTGKEAVEQASETPFDMILMDIMMPEMDGIEATKIIRDSDAKVMIIAVSAAEDETRKKEILNSGAEDYISKPVDASIFQARLGNYFSLIESRRHIPQNEEAVNLYTTEIYSRHTTFKIYSEDTLSEFWEYYLLTDSIKYDSLSDVIRTIVTLSELFLRLDLSTKVIVEESENALYLTLENIDKLDNKLIQLVMVKNRSVKAYKKENSLMSFVVHLSDEQEPLLTPLIEPTIEEATPVHTDIPEPENFLKSTEISTVYDYIAPDDLEEINNYISKLDTLFLMVGSGEISDDDLIEIATYLDRIASMLVTYSESYKIGQSIKHLSSDILTHTEEFIANSSGLGPLCAAFSRDLSRWFQMTFYDGSPSIDFMDDTIIINTQTIGGMLTMNEASNDATDDLDDIFDF